jgi:DUF4097 and DUF4098 domain-containing protein YvlB
VRASTDGRIHLTALKLVRSVDRSRARSFARETEVTLSTQGGSCEIRVRYPQRQTVRLSFWEIFSGFDLPMTEVRLALEVPETLPVSLRSTSGDIETAGLQGPQDLETTSGDVDVADATGKLRAASTSGDITVSSAGASVLRTVSGDVVADGVAGPLDAHTTSGELVVRGARDSLVLGTVSGDIRLDGAPRGVRGSTTSGDIEARGVAGSVRFSTSSGDVAVWLRPPLAGAEIASGSGDITVHLAGGLGCEVELRTSNGRVEASVPLEVRSATRHVLIGRVGQGTIPLLLRSSSGDIHLMGGGN